MKSENIVSIEKLVEISGGDKVFITEMINMFITQAVIIADEMATLLTQKEYDKLKKNAHKFKSSAQIFHVEKLLTLLEKLESLNFDTQNEKEGFKIIMKVKDIVEIVCNQLKEELEAI